MKVLCCGSRTWENRAVVRARLREFDYGTIIVHGDARGADTLIDFTARYFGFEVRPYHAQWDAAAARGNRGSAGPIRNSLMLSSEHPDENGVGYDLCIAFTDDIKTSIGTRDMVRKALKAGIPVEIVDSRGERRACLAA